ncbi:MAG TPA: hypothetical protein VLH75_09940 [Longimicrobiales bacterium]|nr:hypothetical protein [Longimicrobiales bacterium]
MRPEPGNAPDHDKWAAVVSSAEDHVRRDATCAPGRARPLPGRNALLVAAGVVVAVGVALAAPRVMPGSPASLPATEQASDLRAEAALLIEQIEAYRQERGTLPQPSMLSPFLEEGYSYRIVDEAMGRYEVRRTAGGVEVTYDGSLPLGLWLVIGGSSAGGSP